MPKIKWKPISSIKINFDFKMLVVFLLFCMDYFIGEGRELASHIDTITITICTYTITNTHTHTHTNDVRRD